MKDPGLGSTHLTNLVISVRLLEQETTATGQKQQIIRWECLVRADLPFKLGLISEYHKGGTWNLVKMLY